VFGNEQLHPTIVCEAGSKTRILNNIPRQAKCSEPEAEVTPWLDVKHCAT
jgi:hypothetical protein